MKFRPCRLSITVLLSMASLTVSALADPANTANDTDITTLRQELEAQSALIKKQQAQLQQQSDQFNAMQRQLNAISQQRYSNANTAPGLKTQAAQNAASINTPQVAETSSPAPKVGVNQIAPAEVGTDRKPIDQQKMPEITVLDDQAGVLLQRGKFIFEPTVSYANSSATEVSVQGFTIIPALSIGSFNISDVNRDLLTATATGRLGVTNRLELDASIPYIYRDDRTTGRPFGSSSTGDTTNTVRGHDLGDIELDAHYQLNDNIGKGPVYIANARFKTTTGTSPFDVPVNSSSGLQEELPTGSGFYAIQPSITAIFPSDPVVFFGNAGYVYNFGTHVENVGKVSPGDSIDASLGMSVAYNDKTSFSISYEHDLVLKTELDGGTFPDSNTLEIGTLNFGTAYKLYDNVSLDFVTSVGVTSEAPNVQVLFKVPISLDLF